MIARKISPMGHMMNHIRKTHKQMQVRIMTYGREP